MQPNSSDFMCSCVQGWTGTYCETYLNDVTLFYFHGIINKCV